MGKVSKAKRDAARLSLLNRSIASSRNQRGSGPGNDDITSRNWKDRATSKFTQEINEITRDRFMKDRKITSLANDSGYESYVRELVRPKISRILDSRRSKWAGEKIESTINERDSNDKIIDFVSPLARRYSDFITNDLKVVCHDNHVYDIGDEGEYGSTLFSFMTKEGDGEWELELDPFTVGQYGCYPGKPGMGKPRTKDEEEDEDAWDVDYYHPDLP